jgi:hypothetical protein
LGRQTTKQVLNMVDRHVRPTSTCFQPNIAGAESETHKSQGSTVTLLLSPENSQLPRGCS